ncbi:MAG: MAPEG family protein [Methylobacteriaceae bacterium]|nr:MAPEG family protein [Methylobacteriaceae bacterium]
MSIESVLLPLFVQVLLTFVLLGILAVRRQRMFSNREMDPQDLAVRGAREPAPVAQVAGSFQNQFEIPVLFYVLVILALFTRKADLVFVVMSWIFVLARIAQAAIHIGPNIVRVRGMAFGVSMLILLIMWIIFIVRILAHL